MPKRSSDHTPGWAVARVGDAGASAYAWADETLLAAIDPDGSKVRRAQAITGSILAIAAIGVAIAGFRVNLAIGFTAAAILAAGLIANQFSHWPAWSFLIAVPVLAQLDTDWMAAVSLIGLVGLATAAAVRARGIALVSFMLSVLSPALALAGGASWLPWAQVLALAGLGAASGRFHRRVDGRLPFSAPKTPRPNIPFLMRFTEAKALSSPPMEVTRKRIGADGERSTAVRLLGIEGRRFLGATLPARVLVFHDIASLDPQRTEANIDHVVLTERGLFMLDTKVFASGSAVICDGEDLSVRKSGSSTSILKLARSLAVEAHAAHKTLGVEPVAALVIHGATVPTGISIGFADLGIAVEVIHQKDLLGRISAVDRPPLSRSARGSLEALLRAVPASRGGKSKPVRPLPIRYKRSRQPVTVPSRPTLIIESTPTTHVEPASNAVDANAAQLLAAWQAMEATPPAPLDLIADESLRSLTKGAAFEVFVVGEDLQHEQMRALTGPCLQNGNAFAWATDLPNWEVHRRTGQPVFITQIPLDRIILTAPQ